MSNLSNHFNWNRNGREQRCIVATCQRATARPKVSQFVGTSRRVCSNAYQHQIEPNRTSSMEQV